MPCVWHCTLLCLLNEWMNITYIISTNEYLISNKRIYLWYKWRIFSHLHFCKSSLTVLPPEWVLFFFFTTGFWETWSLGSDVFTWKDITYFRNVVDHIHGILWLRSTFSVCKVLLVIIYFFDHYQSNPIILWGGVGRKKKKGILTNTHTKIPFTLILIEPNSSCFEFHNSRRVKLENVSLNNGASVFHQKAVIVLSILTGYQTSGCRFEEWTLAKGTWLSALFCSWLECE